MRVESSPMNLVFVPIVCAVGASKSSYIEDLPIEGWLNIKMPDNGRPFDQLVAAPVEGNSLIGDRIRDGDYAILRLNFEMSEIHPGDICAVLTPYGCLLKHVYLTLDDKVRLVSSNPDVADILLDVEMVEIQGILEQVVIDLRRQRL